MSDSILLSHNCQQDVVLAYYTESFREAGASGTEICLDVDGKGKGVMATRDTQEGEVIFTERPLVCLQHHGNSGSALVCQLCLRFVGSVESQIGQKLQHLVEECRGADGCSNFLEDRSDDEDESIIPNLNGALEMGERLEQIYSLVSPERIAALSSGEETLPMTEGFNLPAPVPCRRGCGVQFCSSACEEQAWEHSHCLLCTAPVPRTRTGNSASAAVTPGSSSAGVGGPSSSVQPAASTSAASSSVPAATSASHSRSWDEHDQEEDVSGIIVDRRALTAFVDHARSTNEIFLLAAQVVAATLLRAAKLLLAGTSGGMPKPTSSTLAEPVGTADGASGIRGAGAIDGGSSNYGCCCPIGGSADGGGGSAATSGHSGAAAASAVMLTTSRGENGGGGAGSCSDAGPSTSGGARGGGGGGPTAAHRSALLAAWQPYQFGWKRCWWESVAVPDDVEDEEEFREQLKGLAADSLELLSGAIRDPRFAPDLLQLEVYGSIVGMFELNNLGLSVPTPVEDYFLAVDALEEGRQKEEVLKVTQPLLDALDSEYATPCEATAFLALQSCINHSCDPNTATTCNSGDRTIKVLAQRDIAAGEEITLSYIDVTLPYKQRQAELRDYGFVCRCARCTADAAALRAKRQKAAKGLKVGHRIR